MFSKLRSRLTYANVMSTLAVFIALGGTAYAAATITGADVVNDSLTGEDVQGRGGSAPVNGSLTSADVGGQAANPATGTPFVEGTLTQWDIKNGTLGSDDVADNSLTGADIDEGSLVGGPGSPSGAAGGDLTGSYPNPLIRSNAVAGDEILDGSIGSRELMNTRLVTDRETIQPGGVATNLVSANCPAGHLALHGGGQWEFPSGQLSEVHNFGLGVQVNGTNRGNAEQDLFAFAWCLPL